MCAAKKAIGKMPLRTLRSGDEVCFTGYQLSSQHSCIHYILHYGFMQWSMKMLFLVHLFIFLCVLVSLAT